VLAFDSQGGGLYVYGTATLTNSNIYSNTAASSVRARLCVTFHRPLEPILELTVTAVRVLVTLASQRVSVCILNLLRHFLHRPDEMFCRLLAFFLAGCGALHLFWHGNANQLKRVRERGTGICVLAF
jgi:hypothetical protein